MDEIKAVSVEEIKRVLDEHFPTIVIKDWFGIELVIRKKLPVHDMLDLVEAVVNACVDDEGNYVPQLRDLSFRMYVLLYFTNIETTMDIESVYDVLYGSTLYQNVVDDIDSEQLDDIKSAIDEQINYLLDSNIRKNEETSRNLYEAVSQINALTSDIDAKDIAGIIKSLGSIGSVDEKKIVDAVMEHKKENGRVENK